MKPLVALLVCCAATLLAEPAELEAKVSLGGPSGGSYRLVALEADAPVDNLRVLHFGRVAELGKNPLVLKLKPWDIRWIEVE
jgi:hypothetical protein